MNRASCFSVACTVPECNACLTELPDDPVDATTTYLDITCSDCSDGHFASSRTVAYGKDIGIGGFVMFND